MKGDPQCVQRTEFVHHAGRVRQHGNGDRDVDLVLGQAPVHRRPAHREGNDRRIDPDAAEDRAGDALDVRLVGRTPMRELSRERLEPGDDGVELEVTGLLIYGRGRVTEGFGVALRR